MGTNILMREIELVFEVDKSSSITLFCLASGLPSHFISTVFLSVSARNLISRFIFVVFAGENVTG